MQFLLFFVAVYGIICHCLPLEERHSDNTTYGLYAYGGSIQGLPVYFADGQAQIGDISLSNATVRREVYFTVSDQNSYTWIAHVNQTEPVIVSRAQSAIDAFATNTTTLLLCLDGNITTSGPVAFTLPEDTAGKIVDTFYLYGADLLIQHPAASFYAVPNGEDKWYSLTWSTEPKDGWILLSLKTIGVWAQPVPAGVEVVQ
ncbi:hypothetical protein N7528_008047 [Penicillium herquei]|nr:hypothetical protein N7528_008047 [Penicillium herquei]